MAEAAGGAGAPGVAPGAGAGTAVAAGGGGAGGERGAERWLAAALVLLAGVVAALPPLHEMDLAQHLATGEWIVQHRAVPFTEPFAWTRAGEPYYAYSWLAQVTYYLLLAWSGPAALHVLEGLIAAATVAATLWAAGQSGWRGGTRLGMAVLQLALLWGVANTIRPQQFLFIALPLAWGLAARIQARGARPLTLFGLAAVGALAANTHLFFPCTAVPVGWFLLRTLVRRCPGLAAAGAAGAAAADMPQATSAAPAFELRRWFAAGAALVAGWLVSPYGLAWPDVFALNFGHNVLLGRPPSIAEFVPGFEYARARPGVVLVAAVLLLVPWVRRFGQGAERLVAAVFWTLGLLLFAYAGRLVLAWWTLAFPLAGAALEQLGRAAAARLAPRLATVLATGGATVALAAAAPPIAPVFWNFEGDVAHRMLPRAGEDPALWLPAWLKCHTRPGAGGRLFTEFNYGSELTWLMPGYSPSIDGRTIFPDSVAVDFSFRPFGRRGRHASTWQYADVALVDLSFWVVPLLAQDTAWLLLAQSRPTSRGSMGTLWAKRAWWAEWGISGTGVPEEGIGVGTGCSSFLTDEIQRTNSTNEFNERIQRTNSTNEFNERIQRTNSLDELVGRTYRRGGGGVDWCRV